MWVVAGNPVASGFTFVRDSDFFDDPDDPTAKYMLVTNRSPNRASRTRLTVSGTVASAEAFDPALGETGTFVPVALPATPPRYLNVLLGPGRARLYRLRTA